MAAGHKTAVELLEMGDVGREKPWLNKYWAQVVGIPFGIITGVAINLGSRRPAFSGIQKHICAVVAWTAVLHYSNEQRNEYYAERDAALRQYVKLHPEDFKEPERIKIADVFEPWIPIR